jgi:hypothetical protein
MLEVAEVAEVDVVQVLHKEQLVEQEEVVQELMHLTELEQQEQLIQVAEQVCGGHAPGGIRGFGAAGGSGIVIIKQNQASPTYSVASGVWSLQCQYNFKKQGTWTPSVLISVDFLVIAGGGGGGTNAGGGGGAGGYRTSFPGGTKINIENGTSYPITVGGGGASGPAVTPSSGTRGSNGSLLYFQLSLQQVVEQVVYLEMMVQEHQVILEVQVEVVAEELMR